jgi:prefoldin subunit 5
MPINDIRTLKRKVDAITTNIKVYERDVARYESTLKEKYNIHDIDDIDSAAKKIEKKIKKLSKKKHQILSKASKILSEVENG